jgi:hypothetical protein
MNVVRGPVHAQVLDARLRIARDHHGHGDERARVLWPRGHDRQPPQVRLFALQHHLLAGRPSAVVARRHFCELGELGQQLHLCPEAARYLRLEQLRHAVRMLGDVFDSQRERHAPQRAEHVDRHRELGRTAVVQQRPLEQQRLATARLLHDPVGDLRELQVRAHGLADAHQLAGTLQLLQERLQVVVDHGR